MCGSSIEVACLCAAWCRLCDEYAGVLTRVAAEFSAQGVELRWHWIDIEDEADLLGDFDVETFPTIVIVDPLAVRFAGALTPHAETLSRLLRAKVVDAGPDGAWPAVGPEVQAFATRLRARVEAG